MVSKYKVALLLSYFSISSISATIISPALFVIQSQFNLSYWQIDWMMSAFLLGYVIGQLFYGPLANRFGYLSSLRAGLVINLVGIIICIFGISFNSYGLMILGRILSALGGASGLACGFMLIGELLPKRQQKSALSYSIFSFTLGIGLAVAIGGFITKHWQWSGCFIVLLVHGLIMLLSTYAFKESNSHKKNFNLSIFKGYKTVLSSKDLVIFSLAAGFSTSISFCFFAAAPFVASELLRITPDEYGYWNLINMLGMLLGGLCSKYLLNRFDAYKVVTAGFILSAFNISVFLLMWNQDAASTSWFFINAGLLSLFGGLIFVGSSYIALGAVKDKAHGSAMMSFINLSISAISVAIMPIISMNAFLSLGGVLAGMWVLIFGILIVFFLFQKR